MAKKKIADVANAAVDAFVNKMVPTIVPASQYTNYAKAKKFIEENKAAFDCIQQHLDNDTNVSVKQRFVSAFDECADAMLLCPVIIAASTKNKSIVFRDEDDMFATTTYKWWSRNKISDNQMLGELLEQTGAAGHIKFLLDIGHCDIISYCSGVIVGMDTNARKNRNGKLMEQYCADIIEACGYSKTENIKNAMKTPMSYIGQVSKKTLQQYGVHVDIADDKRFDFAAFTDKSIVLMESNFYANSGSKLDTICREYSEYGNIGTSDDGRSVKFLWCTDGAGWEKNKASLGHAYAVLGADIMCTLKTLPSTLKKRAK